MQVRGALVVEGSLVAKGGIVIPFAHFQDQKDSGTNGGALTAGAWNERNLNTEIFNDIANVFLTNPGPTNSRITLPNGTYHIEVSAPSHRTDQNRLRLRDAINGVTLLLGPSLESDTADSTANLATVKGRVEVGASSMEIAVEHYITTSQAGGAAGTDAGKAVSATAVSEVYMEVFIWLIDEGGDPGLLA